MSRPSGSVSRSPRRSSERPSPNHASSSMGTSNPAANVTDGDGAVEEEDLYLNDLDKQLEREGLERCPITGMIVEKRDGIVGDIRDGIRKRQRKRAEKGSGKKERAKVQVAVAIVMPTPPVHRNDVVPVEQPTVAKHEKKRKRRRRKVKRDVPTIKVDEKPSLPDPLNKPLPSTAPSSPALPPSTRTDTDATSSPSSTLQLPLASTSLSPTPLNSRPPTRMTLTSDGGSVKSYVTAPDDNLSEDGGAKTPTRVQTPEPRSVPLREDDLVPHVDTQAFPITTTSDSSRADSHTKESEQGAAEDPESEYEEYTDYETDSDSDAVPTKPVLINFGSEEENRIREEAARQIVYAFGLYECQWRLSCSASRSRHQESLRAIGVRPPVGKSASRSGSGSSSGSGYSSGSATGTGASSSEASSGRNSGVASPRERVQGPVRPRPAGSSRSQ